MGDSQDGNRAVNVALCQQAVELARTHRGHLNIRPAPDCQSTGSVASVLDPLCQGVSIVVLQALKDQIKQHGFDIEVMTSFQVYDIIIEPSTEEGAMAYVELLDGNLRGPPEFYVSHSLDTPFSATIDEVMCTIQNIKADQPLDSTYVWIDILCRRSIGSDGKPLDFKQRLADVRTAIDVSTGPSIICIDPRGQSFLDARVLYDVWSSGVVWSGDKMRITLPQIMSPPEVLAILSNTDPLSACTSNASEVSAIREELERRGGSQDNLRMCICCALLEATSAEVKELTSRPGLRPEFFINALHQSAIYAKACGVITEGKVLHAEAARMMAEYRGKDDPLSIACSLGVDDAGPSQQNEQQQGTFFPTFTMSSNGQNDALDVDTLKLGSSNNVLDDSCSGTTELLGSDPTSPRMGGDASPADPNRRRTMSTSSMRDSIELSASMDLGRISVVRRTSADRASDAVTRARGIMRESGVIMMSPEDCDVSLGSSMVITNDTASSSTVLPGISIVALLAFQDQMCKAGFKTDNLTTREVYDQVVKPMTRNGRAAYVELLDAAHRGPHQHYIAHAWGMPFSSLVSQVVESVLRLNAPENASGTYVWLDFLCRRHTDKDGQELPPEQPLQDARAAICASSGLCLLNMDGDGKVLELSHILYEVWCIGKLKGGVMMRALCSEIMTVGHVLDSLAHADPATACCRSVDELSAMLREMEQEGGIVNFRKWLSMILLEAANAEVQELAVCPDPKLDYLACALHKCAVFARACGAEEESVGLHADASRLMVKTHGSSHALSAGCLIGYAEALMLSKKYLEAERHFRKGLNVQLRALGSEHPDSVRACRNLALVLKKLGKLFESETLYRQALTTYERTCDPESTAIAGTCLQLAVLLVSRKNYEEAQQLSERALRIHDVVLGTTNSVTLENMVLLRDLAKLQQNRQIWEKYYRELTFRRARLEGA